MTEISVDYKYRPPKPILLTLNGVSFMIDGSLAIFYRWAQYMDMVDEWMTEFQPYYWPKYQDALRLKELHEQRKREQHESAAENLRLKQNAKKHARRLEMKNGITTPDNAVKSL